MLTRSHVTFSRVLRSSNPTTVTMIRGGSGDKAGCNLIASVQTISLVPYNYNIKVKNLKISISKRNILHFINKHLLLSK